MCLVNGRKKEIKMNFQNMGLYLRMLNPGSYESLHKYLALDTSCSTGNHYHHHHQDHHHQTTAFLVTCYTYSLSGSLPVMLS